MSRKTSSVAAMELASRVYNAPLAIDADSLKFFTWARADIEDIEQWMALALERYAESAGGVEDGVAVIPIRGSLFRGTFGGDYEAIGDALDAAVNDPGVQSILLEVDSPGGEVRGMFDLAERIRQARGAKPIVALADDQATSAAYALASAADEVVASPTATIGSIGVVAAHVDTSKAAEQSGVTITEVSSGAAKTALSSNQPLSKLGRGILEKAVNSSAEQFFSLVSANRNIPVEDIRAQQAGIFFGQEAVDAGLADRVASRSEVLQGLASSSSAPEAPSVSLAADSHAVEVTAKDTPEQSTLNTEGSPIMAESDNTQTEATEETTLDATVEEAVVEETSADESGGEVVDLEQARAEGRLAAAAEAREIVELCTIAGRPAEAANFITSGASIESVRATLLEAKASNAGSEINNAVDALASAGEPQVELDPYAIYRARAARSQEGR